MTPDIHSYDRVIVAFSGGKDSVACLLHLIELGVSRDRLEIWHHDVDGREGSTLMDWACTAAYCRAFAAAFQVPIYFSWKVGGFEREMTRDGAATAPTAFETPSGLMQIGGNGKPGTRLLFPQVSADLSTRYCSAYLKIDVGAAALRNQERFDGMRVLFVTGERAEESPARARYKTFEPHRADNRDGKTRRLVDQWRPVHPWSEKDVWAIMERHRINPHPAYRLGWGRVSCAGCIFGSPNQWASLRKVAPEQFEGIAAYEKKFGTTINRKQQHAVVDAQGERVSPWFERKKEARDAAKELGAGHDVTSRYMTVGDMANVGSPYESLTKADIMAATSRDFREPILLKEGEWRLPAGAYGESCGPA